MTRKPKRDPNARAPVCAACGKRLRKPRFMTEHGPFSVTSLSAPGDHVLTADGLPRARGDYGDNAVCAMKCGYLLAIRILRSIPGVLDLLPAEWNPRGAAAAGKAREQMVARAKRGQERLL
jgi:hypothetical protein